MGNLCRFTCRSGEHGNDSQRSCCCCHCCHVAGQTRSRAYSCDDNCNNDVIVVSSLPSLSHHRASEDEGEVQAKRDWGDWGLSTQPQQHLGWRCDCHIVQDRARGWGEGDATRTGVTKRARQGWWQRCDDHTIVVVMWSSLLSCRMGWVWQWCRRHDDHAAAIIMSSLLLSMWQGKGKARVLQVPWVHGMGTWVRGPRYTCHHFPTCTHTCAYPYPRPMVGTQYPCWSLVLTDLVLYNRIISSTLYHNNPIFTQAITLFWNYVLICQLFACLAIPHCYNWSNG